MMLNIIIKIKIIYKKAKVKKTMSDILSVRQIY